MDTNVNETTKEVENVAKKKDETAIIEVPIDAKLPPTEWGLHIDVRLDVKQSTALRRVASKLDQQQAKLANGTRVVNPSQALKFILEQIA